MYHTLDLGRAIDLGDDAFVQAFEELTLSEPLFKHADHVRLALLYLLQHGLIGALTRCRDGLRRFAAHHGAPEKYHETVTWALIFIINERLQRDGSAPDWPTFAESNPDLLTFRDGPFFDYYDTEVLTSETARRTFVLPGPGLTRCATAPKARLGVDARAVGPTPAGRDR